MHQNRMIEKTGIFFVLFFLVTGTAFSESVDQYGFGDRTFLIQSALEGGKSSKGIWDLKGTKDFFKKNQNQDIQVWSRDKGKDRPDRIFKFQPAGGKSKGKYFIKYAKDRNWGVNAIEVTGKVEARMRAEAFDLKYMGDGRWKIYAGEGWILSLQSLKAEDGTKVVMTPDHDLKNGQWMFFDARTNKSFVPRKRR